jgi:hypothetical protein
MGVNTTEETELTLSVDTLKAPTPKPITNADKLQAITGSDLNILESYRKEERKLEITCPDI